MKYQTNCAKHEFEKGTKVQSYRRSGYFVVEVVEADKCKHCGKMVGSERTINQIRTVI